MRILAYYAHPRLLCTYFTQGDDFRPTCLPRHDTISVRLSELSYKCNQNRVAQKFSKLRFSHIMNYDKMPQLLVQKYIKGYFCI